MKKIIGWIKYWGQILILPIYWCTNIFPRRKEIWLFGSTFGRRFADNPRYLYLYCTKHGKELGIRPIWISHNANIVECLSAKGYEAYKYNSLKGIYYALVGKVYLYDNYSKDINFWQSAGSLKINMWHGIPLKKIQADNKYDRFRNPQNGWERWKNLPRNLSDEKPSDYVLTTSKYMEPIFSSAFRTKNVLICGYPRTDYLVFDEIENIFSQKEQQEVEVVKTYKEKYKKYFPIVVFYMPTFRDSEIRFFDLMNLERFQEYLEANHIMFCIKLHPKSKLKKEFEKISGKGFENILIIDADSDPYVLLKITDILVTDYSSIYFDFLLLDRPIIFFDYDREKYVTESRELYFDYESITPGEKVETMEGLIEAIEHAWNQTEEYKNKFAKQRREVREKMFDTPNQMASPKLVKDIQKIIE